MKFLLFLLVGITAVSVASAQSASSAANKEQSNDAFDVQHKQQRAQNPDGLLFTVRFKDNRTKFRQGEVITLELSFAASKPNTFILDASTFKRSISLELDSFILHRYDGVIDPLDDYFNSGLLGFNGGGWQSIPELTDKPYLITEELNEWMRFANPGSTVCMLFPNE